LGESNVIEERIFMHFCIEIHGVERAKKEGEYELAKIQRV
jgi:hypothetical protein